MSWFFLRLKTALRKYCIAPFMVWACPTGFVPSLAKNIAPVLDVGQANGARRLFLSLQTTPHHNILRTPTEKNNYERCFTNSKNCFDQSFFTLRVEHKTVSRDGRGAHGGRLAGVAHGQGRETTPSGGSVDPRAFGHYAGSAHLGHDATRSSVNTAVLL